MIMRPMGGNSQTGVILRRKGEKLASVGKVLERGCLLYSTAFPPN